MCTNGETVPASLMYHHSQGVREIVAWLAHVRVAGGVEAGVEDCGSFIGVG